MRAWAPLLVAAALASLAGAAVDSRSGPPQGAIVYQVEHPIPGQTQPDIDLCLVEPSSRRTVAVTAPRAGAFEMQPDWSPGGKVIGFSRTSYGEQGSERLRAIAPDGSGERTLAGGRGSDPSWSPGASEVAFVGAGIFVARADGGAKRRLVAPTFAGVGGPAWSVDGAEIAYVTGALAIRSIRVDRTADRELVRDGTTPAWSPNGKRLAFSRDGHIWTAARDGSAAAEVTRGGAEDLAPSWSPDGEWLAFVRRPRGASQGDVYRVRVDGSRLTNVTRSPLDERAPDWGPPSTKAASGPPRCSVLGTARRNHLRGTAGGDAIYAFGGADTIRASAGNDVVDAGAGADVVDARETTESSRATASLTSSAADSTPTRSPRTVSTASRATVSGSAAASP